MVFEPRRDGHLYHSSACRQAEYRRTKPADEMMTRLRAKAPDTDIDREWVQERLDAGICEVTGLPFERESAGPLLPSIDRIIPGGPYSKDNCRMTVWIFNRARGSDSDADVLRMARALTGRVDQ